MKIIVGLGNPGKEYKATRHNVGFMVIDELARRWGIGSWRTKFQADISEARVDNQKILLVKPQTYMNLSGQAVAPLAAWHKTAPQDVVVIYDDLDLAAGKIRLRTNGSSGGHRGMQSIIEQMGTAVFGRIRVGIGRPPAGWTVNQYVLSAIAGDDQTAIAAAVVRSGDAVACIINDGMTKAMNEFSK